MNFERLLEPHRFSDLEILPGGIRAKRRPDVAPLAFEVVIIASAYDCLDEDRIPQFLDGANQVIFEELYRNCNGLHVGATKLGVFGFITGDQSVAVPWNIELPNDVTRAHRPKGTLIVGTSNAAEPDGNRVELYHTIQSEPEIHVTAKDNFTNVLRKYSSATDWLKTEVGFALSDRGNW